MPPAPRTLEIAHQMPGRTRLRWRGPDPLPPELMAQLERQPEIQEANYRPSSRSLVLLHSRQFTVDNLRSLTGEIDVAVQEPSRPEPALQGLRERHEREAPSGGWELLVADLEAILLLGLMVLWARDLITGKVIRVGTVLLLILTGLNLYQYWQRRQQRRLEKVELELITT